MVRAKFTCTRNVDGDVWLQPVIADSEENKQFWKWTPSGEIRLYITNESAIAQFEIGEEYYVDFTKV